MYALIRSNVSIELWHNWMHVFLPWWSFRNPNQELGIYKACEITNRLKEVTIKLHPAHENLPERFLPLHARNHQEVMGENGDDPAKVVLCYTEDGVTDGPSTTNATGGSGQAIRVASLYNIPVKNFQREDDVQWLREAITFVKERLAKDRQEYLFINPHEVFEFEEEYYCGKFVGYQIKIKGYKND